MKRWLANWLFNHVDFWTHPRISRLHAWLEDPEMGVLHHWLLEHVEHKEIGWREIGETFTRFVLLRTRWFNVYLHYLDAPNESPKGCHDHPWSFLTLILRRGYLEYSDGRSRRRWPGMVLYRRAEFSHSITTPYGPSWSLVAVGKRRRVWRFNTCDA